MSPVRAPTLLIGVEDFGERAITWLDAEVRALGDVPVTTVVTRAVESREALADRLSSIVDELLRTRLDRVAAEVAAEEPVVQRHVALGHDAPPRSLATDLQDPVDHQHGGKRKPRLEGVGGVAHQRAVGERQQVFLGEALALEKLFVGHAPSPKRSR